MATGVIDGCLPPWASRFRWLNGRPTNSIVQHGQLNQRSWAYENSATPQISIIFKEKNTPKHASQPTFGYPTQKLQGVVCGKAACTELRNRHSYIFTTEPFIFSSNAAPSTSHHLPLHFSESEGGEVILSFHTATRASRSLGGFSKSCEAPSKPL